MPAAPLSNAEIAERLLSLAQLLSHKAENKFKVKAYRRAARTIQNLGESFDALVRGGADLTQYPGIGKAIDSAIREIVETGALQQAHDLRTQLGPEKAAISEHPKLDPRRVLSIFKKLKISTVDELRQKLESGELNEAVGSRATAHVRQALVESSQVLLYEADRLAPGVEEYLLKRGGATQVALAGAVRRRVEVVDEVAFLVDARDFGGLVEKLREYGGRTEVVSAGAEEALLRLPSGVLLRLNRGRRASWGAALIAATGSAAHLAELDVVGVRRAGASEAEAYRAMGLAYIEPELREGHGEVALAARDALPLLITAADLRGDLHSHSTSSDGRNTVQEMAAAARERGYAYIGISDHSQSLKIAGGLSEAELWSQVRSIDALNDRLTGVRVLKSAEVDILADGSLDYPDALLEELDYTVCSIHSRFQMGKTEQTERVLRAMDNRYFSILGHATGRLLLKRDGYELDMDRVIGHARQVGCFFEINCSPDRLDLSAEHARMAQGAGVKIAINTDAHSTRELDLVVHGIDQARRAGLSAGDVLNCLGTEELLRVVRR